MWSTTAVAAPVPVPGPGQPSGNVTVMKAAEPWICAIFPTLHFC